MVFETQLDYEAYNVHPVHIDFVANRWDTEVKQFMEIDYKEI